MTGYITLIKHLQYQLLKKLGAITDLSAVQSRSVQRDIIRKINDSTDVHSGSVNYSEQRALLIRIHTAHHFLPC